MRQKVVIIGNGSTSRLGIVRALAKLDCEITIIVTSFKNKKGRLNTSKPFDCYSRYISRIFYIFAGETDGLVQLLLDKCVDSFQKVIILPDSDFSAAVIDDNQDKLREHFLFPYIHHTSGEIRRWMNKTLQKELAEEIGLNYVKSCEITIESQHYSPLPSVNYPCFTKPKVSIVGGKKFFRKCDNEEQLKSQLDYIGKFGDSVILIEDYINIESEYALLGFSDGKNVIIPGIIKFIINSKSHFGIALKGMIMPTDGFETILPKFEQLILRIGYVGVFDIDFFWGDGRWWFGEINLRFGGSGYAITKMGVNLPAMLVKHFMGDQWEDMPQKVKGIATYVNERMCIDDWYGGFLTTREFKQLIRSADISFVYDDADPKPQEIFENDFWKLLPKRTIKQIIKSQ